MASNLAQLTDFYDQPETIDSLPVEPLRTITERLNVYRDDPKLEQSLAQGNIDLNNRPIVRNADGSISTVKSKSFNFDGKEILLPSVSDDGKILDNADIIKQYHKTGKHLGEFKTAKEATEYAEKLHKDQDELYSDKPLLSDFNTNVGTKLDNILNKLTGANGQQRYQLWPEKIIRSGLTAAGEALAGNVPQWAVDKDTGEVHTSPQMIEKAQEISALAGTGGLAGGAEGAALNATPSLRPALKYKNRIYKGKEGQQHQDVIPKELYPEFEQMAMNGEDISHYNFGFMNHKGQFLDRDKALEYAINEGLVDAHAGQYGALTSTLMADSSKPGTAIEAAKLAKLEKAGEGRFYIKDADGNELGKLGVSSINDGKTIRIDNIDTKAGANSLGPALIQNLKNQIKEHYPDAENFEGFRTSGVNPKRKVDVALADSSKEGAVVQLNNGYTLKPVDHEPDFGDKK